MLILFGEYKGTVRTSGFHWANPFCSRVRARLQVVGAGNGAERPGHAKT